MTKEKNIIVTGGTRGIGFAISRKLLEDGFIVFITGKSEAGVKKAEKELSKYGTVSGRAFDLGNHRAVAEFLKKWDKPLYGLVNNAGVVEVEHLAERGAGSFERVLGVNLHGHYALTKGLVGHLADNGRIVNSSSQLGKDGRAGYGAYCASKFALIGLTKCWAKELGSRGITVNAVCPGWVRTEMGMNDLARIAKEEGKSAEELYREICEPLELKRFTEPEEVANLVSFLVSDAAGGITGRDMLMHTVWNQQ